MLGDKAIKAGIEFEDVLLMQFYEERLEDEEVAFRTWKARIPITLYDELWEGYYKVKNWKPYMNKPDFEAFLLDVFAEQYSGLDDDMPDAFGDWVAELDSDALIPLANLYAEKMQVARNLNIKHNGGIYEA